MKKFATLALIAALATTASAASITWGFGGQVYVAEGKDSTGVLASTYTGDMPWSLALVYVGQEKTSFSIDALTESSVVDTLAYAVTTSGKQSAIGKWSPATKITTTTAYADKASFAVVLYNTTDKTFDYIYGGSTAAGSAFTSATTVTDMSQQGSAAFYGTGSGTTTGVVVVPEPSVALLGLLGLGMLLKRRRA